MVRFVVEAPLAYDQVGTRVLHHLDHVRKLFLFVIPEFVVLVHSGDVQFVLRLWAWRLERASEDRQAGIFDGRGHLWVRHVLVDEHALDEGGVGQRAADFSVDLDEVKGDIATFDVRNRQHCVHGDLRKLSDLFRDAVEATSAQNGGSTRMRTFCCLDLSWRF
jgi:hypothetical protein